MNRRLSLVHLGLVLAALVCGSVLASAQENESNDLPGDAGDVAKSISEWAGTTLDYAQECPGYFSNPHLNAPLCTKNDEQLDMLAMFLATKILQDDTHGIRSLCVIDSAFVTAQGFR